MEPILEDILENIPEGQVYTLRTIIVSSLLGGLLASSFMIYKNFKVFGENKKAGITIVLTVVAFIAVLSTSFSPAFDKIPGIFYGIFLSLLTSLLAKKYQGHFITGHINKDGKIHSTGNAVLVCIVAILIMAGISFGAFYLEDAAAGNI